MSSAAARIEAAQAQVLNQERIIAEASSSPCPPSAGAGLLLSCTVLTQDDVVVGLKHYEGKA